MISNNCLTALKLLSSGEAITACTAQKHTSWSCKAARSKRNVMSIPVPALVPAALCNRIHSSSQNFFVDLLPGYRYFFFFFFWCELVCKRSKKCTKCNPLLSFSLSRLNPSLVNHHHLLPIDARIRNALENQIVTPPITRIEEEPKRKRKKGDASKCEVKYI